MKIISLPDEDIGDDREGMEGRGEGDVGEDDNSDLSDVMSRLLESLLVSVTCLYGFQLVKHPFTIIIQLHGLHECVCTYMSYNIAPY